MTTNEDIISECTTFLFRAYVYDTFEENEVENCVYNSRGAAEDAVKSALEGEDSEDWEWEIQTITEINTQKIAELSRQAGQADVITALAHTKTNDGKIEENEYCKDVNANWHLWEHMISDLNTRFTIGDSR